MAAVFNRRTHYRRLNNKRLNKGKFRRRLSFILFLLLLFLNFDSIGRIIFPFPYRETINTYAGAYQVDPYLLVAVMKTESGFDRRAVSVSGARGLMQIMPDTGQWVADQLGDPSYHPDRLFDPETNIKYGAWYISDLEKEFHGDDVLVLAAYNGGRGNVRNWISSKNLSGGNSSISRIPFPETREYVSKVLLYYRIYRYLYEKGGA